MFLGREPDAPGIALNSKAVSRNHGFFVRCRNNWFYKDLGSTNGSFVNGNQVKSGQWSLVRNGSVVQVADVALRLSETGGPDRASNMVSALTGRPATKRRSICSSCVGTWRTNTP